MTGNRDRTKRPTKKVGGLPSEFQDSIHLSVSTNENEEVTTNHPLKRIPKGVVVISGNANIISKNDKTITLISPTGGEIVLWVY